MRGAQDVRSVVRLASWFRQAIATMSGAPDLTPLQKYYQEVPKYTYLKGKGDKLTSVLIPLGFGAAAAVGLVYSFSNMYRGTGKKD